MTTQKALSFLINKALELGYDEIQINPYIFELKEKIEQLEDWDEESLNTLFDEIF